MVACPRGGLTNLVSIRSLPGQAARSPRTVLPDTLPGGALSWVSQQCPRRQDFSGCHGQRIGPRCPVHGGFAPTCSQSQTTHPLATWRLAAHMVGGCASNGWPEDSRFAPATATRNANPTPLELRSKSLSSVMEARTPPKTEEHHHQEKHNLKGICGCNTKQRNVNFNLVIPFFSRRSGCKQASKKQQHRKLSPHLLTMDRITPPHHKSGPACLKSCSTPGGKGQFHPPPRSQKGVSGIAFTAGRSCVFGALEEILWVDLGCGMLSVGCGV